MSLFITIYQAQLYTKSLSKCCFNSQKIITGWVLAIIAISHDDIVLTEVMAKFGEQGGVAARPRNSSSLRNSTL